MGSTNFGTQTLGFYYNQEAKAKSFNGVYNDVLYTGIYTGFTLTKSSDILVTLSTGNCVISNGTISVKVSTEETQDISVSYSTPYIVFAFEWESSSTNYMNMSAVAYDDIGDYDLIVGRCIFDDDEFTLQETFDYTRRNNTCCLTYYSQNDDLRVYQTEVASNQVTVTSGTIISSKGTYTVTGGTYPSSGFSDTTDGRNDLLYVDENGDILVLEGTDNTDPVTPDFGNKKVIAVISRGASETTVKGNEITRVLNTFDVSPITEDMLITDEGGYYDSENIEDALQEIAGSDFNFSGTKDFKNITITAQDDTVAETLNGVSGVNIQTIKNSDGDTVQYTDQNGKLWNTVGCDIAITDTYGNYDTDKIEEALNQISGEDMTIDGVKTFTETAYAPTPDSGDSSTKVATTAFVQTISSSISSYDQDLNTTNDTEFGTVTTSADVSAPDLIMATNIKNPYQYDPLLSLALGITYAGNKSVSTISVGDTPYGCCFDGTYIWVTNRLDDTVSKVNATTNSLVTTISVGAFPWGCCFDGTYIWVSNYGNDTVSKIDTDTDTVISTISVEDTPQGICFDGTYIWVVSRTQATLSKIDIDTNSVVATVTVGTGLFGCCFDGTYIWNVNAYDDTVSKVNTSTNSVEATISVGNYPYGICFDGTYIWVTNSGDYTISKINTTTNSVVSTFSTGSTPYGCCFDGNYIWVANVGDNTVSKISTSSNSVVSTISVGSAPRGICFDGTYIWVTNSTDDNVQKLLT